MLIPLLIALSCPQDDALAARRIELATDLDVLVAALPGETPAEGNAPLEACLEALLAHVGATDAPQDHLAVGFLALGYLLDRHDQLLAAPGAGEFLRGLQTDAERNAMRQRARPLTLHGRQDLAAHFFVGAALERLVGAKNARRIGEAKELSDARRLATGAGTGFSFQDLCAHEAGVRFSEHLRRHWDDVRARGPVVLVDWMPFVDDLEEGLSEAAFQERYGGLGGAVFESTMRNLGTRIAVGKGYRRAREEDGP